MLIGARRNIFRRSLIPAASLFIACTSEPERHVMPPDRKPAESGHSAEDADYLRILAEKGFDTAGVESHVDGFTVEGDMFISRENLVSERETGIPLGKIAQRRVNVIRDGAINIVKLQIHSSISAWTKDILQAVNAWNSVNSGLHIYIVTSGPTTIIASDTWTGLPSGYQALPSTTCGKARFYLGSGAPVGDYISMNMDACDMAADDLKRVKVLTHELGHTIGFGHLDGAAGDPATGSQINGTPLSDASVMNSHTADMALNPSLWDRKALHMIYPQDIPMFSTSLDGNALDDITVWRPSDGTWRHLYTGGSNPFEMSKQWGALGDYPLPGTDIDGDGKSDLVVWRPSNTTFYIKTSSSNYATVLDYRGGTDGHIPMPSMNVDSDNKDDLITWDWVTGNWHVLTSTSGYASTMIHQWGQRGDIPMPATDLDYDGKEDLVVYRPIDRTWYAKKSSTGFTTQVAYQKGSLTAVPIPGSDYDGDGKDDIAYLEPQDGHIRYWRSSSNYSLSTARTIGTYGTTPLGETSLDNWTSGWSDLAVWNRITNVWSHLSQENGYAPGADVTFGQ